MRYLAACFFLIATFTAPTSSQTYPDAYLQRLKMHEDMKASVGRALDPAASNASATALRSALAFQESQLRDAPELCNFDGAKPTSDSLAVVRIKPLDSRYRKDLIQAFFDQTFEQRPNESPTLTAIFANCLAYFGWRSGLDLEEVSQAARRVIESERLNPPGSTRITEARRALLAAERNVEYQITGRARRVVPEYGKSDNCNSARLDYLIEVNLTLLHSSTSTKLAEVKGLGCLRDVVRATMWTINAKD